MKAIALLFLLSVFALSAIPSYALVVSSSDVVRLAGGAPFFVNSTIPFSFAVGHNGSLQVEKLRYYDPHVEVVKRSFVCDGSLSFPDSSSWSCHSNNGTLLGSGYYDYYDGNKTLFWNESVNVSHSFIFPSYSLNYSYDNKSAWVVFENVSSSDFSGDLVMKSRNRCLFLDCPKIKYDLLVFNASLSLPEAFSDSDSYLLDPLASDSDLILYYNFDDDLPYNFVDVIGGHNLAILNRSLSFNSSYSSYYVPGKVGRGFYFKDFVGVSNNNASEGSFFNELIPSSDASLNWSVCFAYDALDNVHNNRFVFSKDWDGSTRGYFFANQYGTQTDTDKFTYGRGTSGGSSWGINNLYSQTPVNSSGYVDICVVYWQSGGVGYQRIYSRNSSQSSASSYTLSGVSTLHASNSANFTLGGQWNGGINGQWYGAVDGYIDEFRFYNIALSLSEVEQVFNFSGEPPSVNIITPTNYEVMLNRLPVVWRVENEPGESIDSYITLKNSGGSVVINQSVEWNQSFFNNCLMCGDSSGGATYQGIFPNMTGSVLLNIPSSLADGVYNLSLTSCDNKGLCGVDSVKVQFLYSYFDGSSWLDVTQDSRTCGSNFSDGVLTINRSVAVWDGISPAGLSQHNFSFGVVFNYSFSNFSFGQRVKFGIGYYSPGAYDLRDKSAPMGLWLLRDTESNGADTLPALEVSTLMAYDNAPGYRNAQWVTEDFRDLSIYLNLTYFFLPSVPISDSSSPFNDTAVIVIAQYNIPALNLSGELQGVDAKSVYLWNPNGTFSAGFTSNEDSDSPIMRVSGFWEHGTKTCDLSGVQPGNESNQTTGFNTSVSSFGIDCFYNSNPEYFFSGFELLCYANESVNLSCVGVVEDSDTGEVVSVVPDRQVLNDGRVFNRYVGDGAVLVYFPRYNLKSEVELNFSVLCSSGNFTGEWHANLMPVLAKPVFAHNTFRFAIDNIGFLVGGFFLLVIFVIVGSLVWSAWK